MGVWYERPLRHAAIGRRVHFMMRFSSVAFVETENHNVKIYSFVGIGSYICNIHSLVHCYLRFCSKSRQHRSAIHAKLHTIVIRN